MRINLPVACFCGVLTGKFTDRACEPTLTQNLFARGRSTRTLSNARMSDEGRADVRAGLEACLARLWRYAITLSRRGDVAEDLMRATCRRAIERADQFVPGTRLDHWLFTVLRSTWINEFRSQQVREAVGLVDAASIDGAPAIEVNIVAAGALEGIFRLREAQRETVLLVYGENYSYAEAANALGIPISTVVSRLAEARAALAKLE
jgi:RNA polymerase sigma-70 factor (ECF subfamily)